MSQENRNLSDHLWRIYNRPDPPIPWDLDGNLPWNDRAFSERMLELHLDQSHGAASRPTKERRKQLDWLWQKLELQEGDHVLDFTCGPGLYAVDLAQRGCYVTGIDFGPASIAYARRLAAANNAQDRCEFIEEDVRKVVLPENSFDAALFLYGQAAVFRRGEAIDLFSTITRSLKMDARLALELLNQDNIDKKPNTWWFTDDQGLWGDRPFLHLGERFWLADEKITVDRFHVIDLQAQEMLEVNLCEQSYAVPELEKILKETGFSQVEVFPAWGELDLSDATEWVVYIAHK